MHTTPDLQGIKDPIPFLQIYAEHVRTRIISAKEVPIKKRSIDQYLRSIGKIFASVGADETINNHMGKLHFRLGRQLESYHREDYPPTRVLPLPVNTTQDLDTASQGTTHRKIAISDLTCIVFFFLFRCTRSNEPNPYGSMAAIINSSS